MNHTEVPSESGLEPKPRNLKRACLRAAIVGAVVWAILGVAFGQTLLDTFVINWDNAPSHAWALFLFLILVLPVGFLLEATMSEPPGLLGMALLYALNGAVWGLAILFAYTQGAALWRLWRRR